jgi:hypothetical protein
MGLLLYVYGRQPGYPIGRGDKAPLFYEEGRTRMAAEDHDGGRLPSVKRAV